MIKFMEYGENMEKHYIIEVKLDQIVFYLLWKDERFMLIDDKFLFFKGKTELHEFINENKLLVDEDVESYDLDSVIDLIPQLKESEKCNKILDCWNLFSDMAQTIGIFFSGDSDDISILYEKIVLGSNIETLKNAEYHPLLTNEENKLLESVLCDGISIFRKGLLLQVTSS